MCGMQPGLGNGSFTGIWQVPFSLKLLKLNRGGLHEGVDVVVHSFTLKRPCSCQVCHHQQQKHSDGWSLDVVTGFSRLPANHTSLCSLRL